MVLARSCTLTAGSQLLAKGMQRKEQTVRQQLRAWYSDTPRKRGLKRQALRVETYCAPLLGWVGSEWQAPTGAGAGCHHRGPALWGAGHRCGLSRLCHPRGVGDRACGRHTRLAAGVAALAAPASSPTPRLDGDRAGRSGLVCAVAVAAYHPVGLASVVAHQHRRERSTGRGGLLVAFETLGPAAGCQLVRHGPRLDAHPGPLPLAGPLGGRLHGPVVDPERSAARGQ
jgi:hypothetical protein